MVWPPYYVAARLCILAEANWEGFDGALGFQGVDPLALEPPRFLNTFIHWLRRNILDGTEQGNQQWQMLIERLNTPPDARAIAAPPGVRVPTMSEREAIEAATFAAATGAE